MVGAVVPSQAAAMQAVALGGFLLVFLLSGLMFPVENIPAGLRWISNFIWGKYYIEIVRDALLQGGGWPAMWFKVLIIGVIGLVFYALAWRRNACNLRIGSGEGGVGEWGGEGIVRGTGGYREIQGEEKVLSHPLIPTPHSPPLLQ